MDTVTKSPFFLGILILLMFLVGAVYSAFATIDEVVISSPSTASLGEEVQVRATVYTRRSG